MKRKYVNITPGICGYTSHMNIIEGPEEGIAEIGGQWYSWFGGCPRCVEDKLEELRKELNEANKSEPEFPDDVA